MADEGELPADAAVEKPAEVLSDRGQRLVRRRPGRPRKHETTTLASIDDVAKRHAEREARYEPPEEPKEAEAFVHTPDDEVPPEEPDPAKRDRATYGEIKLRPEYDPEYDPAAREPAIVLPDPPVKKTDKLRTIEDICSHFDLDGSGQFFVMVMRQQPKAWQGSVCFGRMKNIVDPISHDEFVETYGGGQYQLLVYGPPKRGGLIELSTGLAKPVCLSDPIPLTIPWQGQFGLPPNILASADLQHRQPAAPFGSDVTTQMLSRQVNTMADAKIVETTTQKDLTMDQREREDRRVEREEKRQHEATAAELIKETSSEAMRHLRDQLERVIAENRELRSGKKNGSTDMEAIATLIGTLQGSKTSEGELARMRDGYEDRLRQMRELYEQRIKELTERHLRDIEDRERILTGRVEDSSRRGDEQARILQERLANFERQVLSDKDRDREDARRERDRTKGDHDRELEQVRKEHEREMARQKEQYENLLVSERSANARERDSLKENLGVRGDVMKSNVESELRIANNEIERLRLEITRLAADNEKKGNLPKMIKEATDMAEALGMSKDDGGGGEKDQPTIPEMLVRAVPQLIAELPKVIQAAGNAAAQRAMARQPQQQVAEQSYAPAPYPLTGAPAGPITHVGPHEGWATEQTPHSPSPVADYQPPPLPAAPVPEPMLVPPQARPLPEQVPSTALSAAPAPARREERRERRREARAERAPAPRASAEAAPASPPAPTASGLPPISDVDILQIAPRMEKWVEEEASPEASADWALAEFPPIVAYAPALTPEFISAVLERNGRGLSPLRRRPGQQFLKRFRDHIMKRSSTPP